MLVDTHHLVEHDLHWLEVQHSVDNRGERSGHGAYKVGRREHLVAERGLLLAVVQTGRLNDVADAHVGWAGHFTSLAVQAVFQSLVVVEGLLQSVAFAVGTGLFRSRKVGIDRRHGAVYRADCTLYTVLEVVVAYICCLIAGIAERLYAGFSRIYCRCAHCFPPFLLFNIWSATLKAVISVTPAPDSSLRALQPPITAPAAKRLSRVEPLWLTRSELSVAMP